MGHTLTLQVKRPRECHYWVDVTLAGIPNKPMNTTCKVLLHYANLSGYTLPTCRHHVRRTLCFKQERESSEISGTHKTHKCLCGNMSQAGCWSGLSTAALAEVSGAFAGRRGSEVGSALVFRADSPRGLLAGGFLVLGPLVGGEGASGESGRGEQKEKFLVLMPACTYSGFSAKSLHGIKLESLPGIQKRSQHSIGPHLSTSLRDRRDFLHGEE